MNLADLEKTFWGDQREQPTQVRLARVVNALREEAGPTIRMLEIQAAECFPEINEHGQKHFVRVVMESAAEELKEILGDPEAATAGAIQPQGEGSDRKTNEFGEGQRAGRVPQGVSQVDRRRDGDAGSAEGSSVCFVRHDAEASKSAHVTGRDEAGRVHHVGGEGHHCLNEKVAGGSTREDEKAVEAAGDKGPVSVNSPAADCSKECRWFGHADGVFWSAHGVGRKLGDGQKFCDDCGGLIRLEPHNPPTTAHDAELQSIATYGICQWWDEIEHEPGILREFKSSTCGTPKWREYKGSYHNRFTALYFEEMGRCQCGGVIVILGEEEG